jgi:hypothetical protein
LTQTLDSIGFMSVTTEEVARIRTEYLRQAVLWVHELAAQSRIDARIAASQLRHYFEWVQDSLLPEQEGPLLEQIEALCTALAEYEGQCHEQN